MIGLIATLNATPPMTRSHACDLYNVHSRLMFDKQVNTGKTLGEVTESVLRPYFTADDPIAYLRAINDDIIKQARIVSGLFSEWLETGERPPPHYAWRVTVILRKAKEFDLEAAFLRAYCRHFYSELGATDAKISARFRKTNGLPPRQPSDGADNPEVRSLQVRAPTLALSILTSYPNDEAATSYHYDFEYLCLLCDGRIPDAPSSAGPDDLVSCMVCGEPFGTLADIQALATILARIDLGKKLAEARKASERL